MKTIAASVMALFVLWLGAGAAQSQDVNITGNWSCGMTVSGGGRAGSAIRFGVALYPNKRFRARGTSAIVGSNSRGSGRYQFNAQGTWRLVRGRSGTLLALNGTMHPTNGYPPSRFTFGSYIRSARLMAYRGAQSGKVLTSSCRR